MYTCTSKIIRVRRAHKILRPMGSNDFKGFRLNESNRHRRLNFLKYSFNLFLFKKKRKVRYHGNKHATQWLHEAFQ